MHFSFKNVYDVVLTNSGVFAGAVVNGTRDVLHTIGATKDKSMRGLTVFISEIRKAKSQEDEDKIINNELAKIRRNFKNRIISGYNKKKYVLKLLYIFLLGRKFDYGHSEALSLLSSNVYSEKQMGYLFISLLFDMNGDGTDLLIQCIKSDLISSNMDHANLALQCIANIGNTSMASTFIPIVHNLIENSFVTVHVKQSANLCLMHLYRVSKLPSRVDNINSIINMISNEDLCLVITATSLLDEILKTSTNFLTDELLRILVTEIHRIVTLSRPGLSGYIYYRIPAPWLLIRLLAILNHFPKPNSAYLSHLLNEALNYILDRTEDPSKCREGIKDVSYNNSKYAVFFEALKVIIEKSDQCSLKDRATHILGQCLRNKITNFRYLALEAIENLSVKQSCNLTKAIVFLEKEPDPSIQRKALRCLFTLCDNNSKEEVVEKMFSHMRIADQELKHDAALQIANVADNYHQDCYWYIIVLLRIIKMADENIYDRIYSRLYNIITKRPEVQKFATETICAVLKEPSPPESIIKTAALFLGDFGHLISNNNNSTAIIQFQLLKSNYSHCNSTTKAALLTSLMKLAVKFPGLQPMAEDFFLNISSSPDSELQTRAVEYLNIFNSVSDEKLATVFAQGSLPINDVLDKEKFMNINENRPLSFVINASKHDCVNPPIPVVTYSDKGETVTEDDLIKISTKSSFRGSSGRIYLTYDNKSSSELGISVSITTEECTPNFILTLSQIPNSLKGLSSVQQTLAVECLRIFHEIPEIKISLTTENKLHTRCLKLPLNLSTFIEPTLMNRTTFFERWASLKANTATAFSRQINIDDSLTHSAVKRILMDFNLETLEDVDPNPNNYVCAGIFRTATTNVGCLVKLETELFGKQYYITVRSLDVKLSDQIVNMLHGIL